MPIPRNWSEELVCEWLCLEGYSTEVGIIVGTGGKGGRKEADIVGVKVSQPKGDERILEIYHVEVGQLAGNQKNSVETLKEKFSKTRRDNIIKRFKKRMAFVGKVKYDKLYIHIWEMPTKVKKLRNNEEIIREGIKVWTIGELYRKVLPTIWELGNTTVSESYWMLKLLESLQVSGLLKLDTTAS